MSVLNQYMLLKIFINSDDEELKNIYKEKVEKHNLNVKKEYYDSGFDLLCPYEIIFGNRTQIKIDYNIICSAKIIDNEKLTSKNTGYYLYPRSSISKTLLRMANSVGIIDSGYRGNIIGVFDKIQNGHSSCEKIEKHQRLLQICSPNLMPIIVEIVENKNDIDIETERGDGGFGSTGI